MNRCPSSRSSSCPTLPLRRRSCEDESGCEADGVHWVTRLLNLYWFLHFGFQPDLASSCQGSRRASRTFCALTLSEYPWKKLWCPLEVYLGQYCTKHVRNLFCDKEFVVIFFLFFEFIFVWLGVQCKQWLPTHKTMSGQKSTDWSVVMNIEDEGENAANAPNKNHAQILGGPENKLEAPVVCDALDSSYDASINTRTWSPRSGFTVPEL
jgi:hypothetical protein